MKIQLQKSDVNPHFYVVRGLPKDRFPIPPTVRIMVDNHAAEKEIVEAIIDQCNRALTVDPSEETELFHAFKNRGPSPLKRRVAQLLRDADAREGRETSSEYWYAKED